MAKKTTTPSFEKALGEFESLVEKMEQGELTLEQSMAHYERGIALSKICQQALDEAEQRVQILNEKTATLHSFSGQEPADDEL